MSIFYYIIAAIFASLSIICAFKSELESERFCLIMGVLFLIMQKLYA